ncbi:hypothetical protein D9756_004499 [Leucocoprinus leucothites]|uniref:Nephrocystin 3-like N-terminal domain-containing protein n=1 Tax=Leucocoprinus leucothites TaxID=201217 RepID=A0A8H5G9W6_9AGAR|nr:hypothetical protein D9756_004499 [Leucoagaricus leucothites]
MSVLPGAHDVVINGGQFIANQSGTTGIDILYEASTPEASVDAEERVGDYALSCYEGTRVQYIKDITTWATASNEGDSIPPLYWMKGPAAVGKSAVAQTCAERLQASGHLAAAFFFSVNGRRKDHTRFFPTLAHQLSTTLPDYRNIVNRKVSVDRSLVKKTMSSQFRSLIAEPLQELRELGKDIQRRAIFIDGLDECESTSAQMEIIKIIASSIQAGSTPFRWAVFSREEPHIVSTFASFTETFHYHSVLLPISRKADGEIELYLRGGFENILRRRNLLHLSSSWPTAKQIQMFVDAAAGLFAHPATVLRFIDRHSYPEIEEILEAILNPISKRGRQLTSAYAGLDALYTFILQHVPVNILSSMQLLFSYLVLDYDGPGWSPAFLCNVVGISERHFRGIYHHVQAVIEYQEYPASTFDETINLEHSFFDHNLSLTPESSLYWTLGRVHGGLAFRHKSFYDFLHDPARSSSFCVTTLAMRQNLFDRLIQQHHHYASGYVIQDTKLVSRPGMASSSALLSWPQGSEFVNSYITIWTFNNISFSLSHNHPMFRTFMEDFPPSSLQKLAELEYRKSLLATIMMGGIGVSSRRRVFCLGGAGVIRINECTMFSRLKDYTEFDPDMFLAMVNKLEGARVIRPYHPRLGSSRAASVLHTISRQKRFSIKSGLYKLGHGDKSVIWFWEFDTEKQYFHQFRTVNYEEAMALYKAEKFSLWDVHEDEDSSGAEDEDSSSVGDEDSGTAEDEGGSIVEARGEPGHVHGDESGHEANEEQKKEILIMRTGRTTPKYHPK